MNYKNFIFSIYNNSFKPTFSNFLPYFVIETTLAKVYNFLLSLKFLKFHLIVFLIKKHIRISLFIVITTNGKFFIQNKLFFYCHL